MNSENRNQTPEKPLGPLGWSLIVFVPIILFVLVVMRLTSQYSQPKSEPSLAQAPSSPVVQPTRPRPKQPENPNVSKDIENQLVVQMTQITMQQVAQVCLPWVEPDLSALKSLRVQFAVSGEGVERVQELRIRDSGEWLFSEKVLGGRSDIAGSSPYLASLAGGKVWFWDKPEADAQTVGTTPERSLWSQLTKPVPLEILNRLISNLADFESIIAGDAVVDGRLCYAIDATPSNGVYVPPFAPLGLQERVLGEGWTVEKLSLVVERTTSLLRELTLIGADREMTVSLSDYAPIHGGSEAPATVSISLREGATEILTMRCAFGWDDLNLWALNRAEMHWLQEDRIEQVHVTVVSDESEITPLLDALNSPDEM